MTIDELKDFSDLFEEDIYEAISLKTCVEKRVTTGAPGKSAILKEISVNKEFLNKVKRGDMKNE